MNNIFTDGWESRCEAQFLDRNNDKLKAYICSPLRADTVDEVRKNMLTAKAYMLYALEAIGVYAYAPHAFMPIFLSDENPSQRKLALQIGMQMLAFSNFLYICGDCITDGMKCEIIYAAKLGKQIYVFNPSVYTEIIVMLAFQELDIKLVSLHEGYKPLGSSRPITEYMLTDLRNKEQYNGLSI